MTEIRKLALKGQMVKKNKKIKKIKGQMVNVLSFVSRKVKSRTVYTYSYNKRAKKVHIFYC